MGLHVMTSVVKHRNTDHVACVCPFFRMGLDLSGHEAREGDCGVCERRQVEISMGYEFDR